MYSKKISNIVRPNKIGEYWYVFANMELSGFWVVKSELILRMIASHKISLILQTEVLSLKI